jgi:DNA-directed RNA polymerase specialized sigma24 family protein
MNPCITSPEPCFDTLYRDHWQRLVGLAEHLGSNTEDAQDAVQDIFTAVVRRGHQDSILAMSTAWQATHLNLMLRSHLNNLWRNARAQKRGGGAEVVAWDDVGNEVGQLTTGTTPALEFDRAWLRRALDQAMATMQREASVGLWQSISEWLQRGPQSTPQPNINRVTLHRAKARLRAHILQAAHTTSFAGLFAQA